MAQARTQRNPVIARAQQSSSLPHPSAGSPHARCCPKSAHVPSATPEMLLLRANSCIISRIAICNFTPITIRPYDFSNPSHAGERQSPVGWQTWSFGGHRFAKHSHATGGRRPTLGATSKDRVNLPVRRGERRTRQARQGPQSRGNGRSLRLLSSTVTSLAREGTISARIGAVFRSLMRSTTSSRTGISSCSNILAASFGFMVS